MNWMRDQFRALKETISEMRGSLDRKTLTTPERMAEIKDQIKGCRYIAESPKEKGIVHKATNYLEKCYIFRAGYETGTLPKPKIDSAHLNPGQFRVPESSIPKQLPASLQKTESKPKNPDYALVSTHTRPWELTYNDKRFLRPLKISPD